MTLDKNCWDYYQTATLGVFPYMSGVPVYRDGMLPFLYTKAREAGKIEMIFCGDDLNMDMFVDFFHKRKTMQVLGRIESDKTIMPVGFSWVDNPVGVDGARAALCGFGFFDDAGYPVGGGWDEIPFPEIGDDHAYALEVSGDSMEPLFRDGDVVIVSPAANVRRGDRVVVRTIEGEVMVKQLVRQTAKRIDLASINPAHPGRSLATEEVGWMARILWASQ